MEGIALTVVAVVASFAAGYAVRALTSRRTLADTRRALVSVKAELTSHERLEVVGHLVSELAQDLKSPLQGVLGNTELMLASAGRGEVSTEELEQIHQNAKRAAGIVRNLIAFTETASLVRRWHDLNDIVARAVDAFHPEMQASHVAIDFERAEHLPLVYVDGRQLEKVVLTLLARALASVEQRRLDPGRAFAPAAIALATRRSESPDDRLILEVDEGPTEERDDQAFWSADLAACRRVVEAHGGLLEVDRRGDTFILRLELPVSADVAFLASRPGGTDVGGRASAPAAGGETGVEGQAAPRRSDR